MENKFEEVKKYFIRNKDQIIVTIRNLHENNGMLEAEYNFIACNGLTHCNNCNMNCYDYTLSIDYLDLNEKERKEIDELYKDNFKYRFPKEV